MCDVCELFDDVGECGIWKWCVWWCGVVCVMMCVGWEVMIWRENNIDDVLLCVGYELCGIYGMEEYWLEKKLKICVTGAGGFIGSYFVK